jgi:FKBP-type peptidyl-prolyl cis-trans isomerase 2
MKIAAGTVVRIEYELRVKGGDVLESSEKTGPLQYTHGDGRLLPALEKRLEGLSAGESKEGDIPASEVVPPPDKLPTRVVPRRELGGQGEITMGELFEAHTPEGAAVKLEVIAMDDKHVTMRLVPPLAGKDLVYKVKVIRIEDPISHAVSVMRRPPPPLPAEALHIELEPDSSVDAGGKA